MANNSTGILLLGGAGLAIYGYLNNWFASMGFPYASAVPVATPVTVATAAAAPPVSSGPPPLGTTVTTANDALAQVAANDAYIIPDAPTAALLRSATPAGYSWITTTDKGPILLRADVYAPVQTNLTNTINRATAAGAALTSIQAAGQITLAGIQQIMSTAGLSGLGDFKRHMFTRTGRVA